MTITYDKDGTLIIDGELTVYNGWIGYTAQPEPGDEIALNAIMERDDQIAQRQRAQQCHQNDDKV